MPDEGLGAQIVDLIDGAAEPVTLDEVKARASSPRRARGRATAAIAVAAVIVVAVGVVLAIRDRHTTAVTTPATVVTTPTSTTASPSTGDPVAALPKLPASAISTYALPPDFHVAHAVAALGSLWLTGYRSPCAGACASLYRLDRGVGAVDAIPGPPADGLGVAFGDGSLYVLSDRPDGSPYKVTRVDVPSYRVRYSVDVTGTHVYGNTNPIARIAYGFGSVWVFDGNNAIARLDARTGAQTARIELPPDTASNGLAVNEAGVWSVAWGATGVARVDPNTNKATLATTFAPGFAQSIAATDRAVWTTNFTKVLDLYRLDVVHSPVEQHAAKIPTGDVAAEGGQVWFLGWIPGDKLDSPGNHPGLLGEVDPVTLAVTGVTELPIGAVDETQLVVGDGAAWVADSTAHRAWRIQAPTG